MITKVMPLKHEPRYVRHHRSTPNLIESTRSSTRNNLRSSTAAALMCDTATSDNSLTFSCGSDISYSRNSLQITRIIPVSVLVIYKLT